jgi:hypothetical protein
MRELFFKIRAEVDPGFKRFLDEAEKKKQEIESGSTEADPFESGANEARSFDEKYKRYKEYKQKVRQEEEREFREKQARERSAVEDQVHHERKQSSKARQKERREQEVHRQRETQEIEREQRERERRTGGGRIGQMVGAFGVQHMLQQSMSTISSLNAEQIKEEGKVAQSFAGAAGSLSGAQYRGRYAVNPTEYISGAGQASGQMMQQMVQGASAQLTSETMMQNMTNTLVGSIGGSLIGGIIGSLVPGVGTAVGAGLGGTFGTQIASYFNQESQATVETVSGLFNQAVGSVTQHFSTYTQEVTKSISAYAQATDTVNQNRALTSTLGGRAAFSYGMDRAQFSGYAANQARSFGYKFNELGGEDLAFRNMQVERATGMQQGALGNMASTFRRDVGSGGDVADIVFKTVGTIGRNFGMQGGDYTELANLMKINNDIAQKQLQATNKVDSDRALAVQSSLMKIGGAFGDPTTFSGAAGALDSSLRGVGGGNQYFDALMNRSVSATLGPGASIADVIRTRKKGMFSSQEGLESMQRVIKTMTNQGSEDTAFMNLYSAFGDKMDVNTIDEMIEFFRGGGDISKFGERFVVGPEGKVSAKRGQIDTSKGRVSRVSAMAAEGREKQVSRGAEAYEEYGARMEALASAETVDEYVSEYTAMTLEMTDKFFQMARTNIIPKMADKMPEVTSSMSAALIPIMDQYVEELIVPGITNFIEPMKNVMEQYANSVADSDGTVEGIQKAAKRRREEREVIAEGLEKGELEPQVEQVSTRGRQQEVQLTQKQREGKTSEEFRLSEDVLNSLRGIEKNTDKTNEELNKGNAIYGE